MNANFEEIESSLFESLKVKYPVYLLIKCDMLNKYLFKLYLNLECLLSAYQKYLQYGIVKNKRSSLRPKNAAIFLGLREGGWGGGDAGAARHAHHLRQGQGVTLGDDAGPRAGVGIGSADEWNRR